MISVILIKPLVFKSKKKEQRPPESKLKQKFLNRLETISFPSNKLAPINLRRTLYKEHLNLIPNNLTSSFPAMKISLK